MSKGCKTELSGTTSVALTGATGTIGRHVLAQLVSRGCRVKALSRTPPNDSQAEWIAGDLMDERALRTLVADCDTVIHCAGEIRDSSRMHAVNAEAPLRLIRTAADSGVTRFCHLSSAGVVGPTSARLIDESTACRPSNIYERSKLAGEQALIDFASGSDISLWVLRPTNVVDRHAAGLLDTVISSDWRSRLKLFANGGEGAHLIHAADVAAAAIHLVSGDKPLTGVYFAGCDEDTRNTIAGVLTLANKILSRKSMLERCYLPVGLSHAIRCARTGSSLHGNARFSSAKLLGTGFTFPLGLEGAVRTIVEAPGFRRTCARGAQ